MFSFLLLALSVVPSLVSAQYGYGADTPSTPSSTSSSAAAASSSVAAPGQHIVMVGQGNTLTFTPPSVNASAGDTVTFLFVGAVPHSVSQSSFDAPCSVLAGGFNSGLMPLGTNFTLSITNGTQPIYAYCEQTVPAAHCIKGMVFTINAPSPDNSTAFVSAATALTAEPSQTATGLVSSGIGAFATSAPTVSAAPAASGGNGAQRLAIGAGSLLAGVFGLVLICS